MLDTLQKMSGTTHKSFKDSKTVTRDMERIMLQNEGKVSYTVSTKEVPVVSYNDMAFISERNSIVFRAGDSPIWNRNETILPMSWKLLQNTIKQPGKDYTFQTIPTLSSAKDFDRRKNQPDFGKMLDKRMAQAIASEDAKSTYQSIYNYSDWDIAQLDPDVYAGEVMEIINNSLQAVKVDDDDEPSELIDDDFERSQAREMKFSEKAEVNTEQMETTAAIQQQYAQKQEKRFAGKTLSQEDLVSNGQVNHSYDRDIIRAYQETIGYMTQDSRNFYVANNNLYGLDNTEFIMKVDNSESLAELNRQAKNPDSNVYAEEDVREEDLRVFDSYIVTDEFIKWLAQRDRWDFANGEFETQMKQIMLNG